MKTRNRLLTLAAAAVTAALLSPKAEAACRVAVGVRVGAPYRMVGGIRFYGVRPGPAYVWVGGGWALPPYAGANWVPGHWTRYGAWIHGHWRS